MTQTTSKIDTFCLVDTFIRFLSANETSKATLRKSESSDEINQAQNFPSIKRTPLEQFLLAEPIDKEA